MAKSPSTETILQEVLERSDPQERAAYLDRVCAGDEALRREIESLMEAHAAAGSFMDSLSKPVWIPQTEKAGDRIGRYKLLELIGEGGFGRVWMAEQREPMQRRVALKIVKLGMDTGEVLRRFEAERQALARMNHPNIAKVFDGGATDSGRPYFVMELVRGVPITDYCDANRLAARRRIEIFRMVCEAVQHAHQKGIIHRDLKPANILVSVQDDKPVPKVIDFGVAKALELRLTEHTLYTRFNQWVGTPAYMSPEQAGLGGLDVDTRSDVYTLGAILYELLTGDTPFGARALREEGYEAILQKIREEDAPKASTRLSSLAGDDLSSVADHRSESSEKLSREIRGELDWILLKALERDRGRRYETADALAKDLKAFSEREPISAAPPTFAYQAGRYLRKHWKAASVATAFIVLLVATTAVSTWQTVRATRAEEDTRLALAEIEKAERSQTRLRERAGVEEGMAWIDRAAYYEEKTGQEFEAALMAARAIGFEGFGREAQDGAFRESYPVFFEPGSEEFAHARQEVQRYARISRPIWNSPAIRHHLGAVRVVAFSPDGRTLASGSEDSTIKLWDPQSGEATRKLVGNGRKIYSMAFSPDGRFLASGNEGCTVELWDLEGGGGPRILNGKSRIWGLAFSPDGRLLAVGDKKEIKIWDLENPGAGAESKSFPHANSRPTARHFDRVTCLAFSPDGRTLASGGMDRRLIVWDLESGTPKWKPVGHGKWIMSVAFSPDGGTVATGGADDTIKLWDVEGDGKAITLPTHHTAGVSSVAFSPDGRTLASGSSDKTIRRWDLEAGGEPGLLTGHGSWVHSVAFSPDGKTLASGSQSGRIGLWNPEDSGGHQAPASHSDVVSSVTFSPDGRMLASGSLDDTILLWDLAKGGRASILPGDRRVVTKRYGRKLKIPRIYIGHQSNVQNVVFSPGGKFLASTGKSKSVLLWDLESGGKPKSLESDFYDDTAAGVAFGPDGRFLAKGRVLWDLDQGGDPVRLDRACKSLAFSPDGKLLAGGERNLMIWNLERGRAAKTISRHEGRVECVAFSPDGRMMASGGADNVVMLWRVEDIRNLHNGGTPRRLTSHQDRITSLAFSPDGKTFASASADDTIRLWDLGDPENIGEPRSIVAHGDGVESVAFSPDGQILATACRDHSIKLWGVQSTPDPNLDLAGYLSDGWLDMKGREVHWRMVTDRLAGAWDYEFINVPSKSHLAMLQRGEPPAAFFNQYSKAHHWNGALATFTRLNDSEATAGASAKLISWLNQDVESEEITPGTAALRLRQLAELFDDTVLESSAFQQLEEKLTSHGSAPGE